MNAIELANELINWYPKVNLCVASAIMLRQQAKEIEVLNQSYEILFKHRIEQEKEIEQFRFILRNLTLATSKKIGDLEKELEDCTCQGGHSEAYLKAKGKLPKQSLVEDLNDMHIAKSIQRAREHFKFGEKK